jgi:tetratricopeptide (TPR) repeat protein
MMVFLILTTGLLGPGMALRVPQDAPKTPESAAVELTSQEKADPITAARQLIDQRENPGRLTRAALLLEWRKDHGSEAAEVHALLGEAHSRMVEMLNPEKAVDRRRMRVERESGLRDARDAVRLAPNQAEGHYWLGWLLLQTADAEQSYSRLKEAVSELLQAQQLDPKVDEGGPARMLGRIYQETPGWPLLGSRTKAIRWYTKSLEAAPEALRTHLWLGQTYAQDGQSERARLELEKVSAAKPRTGHEKETMESRQEAETLLKTLLQK